MVCAGMCCIECDHSLNSQEDIDKIMYDFLAKINYIDEEDLDFHPSGSQLRLNSLRIFPGEHFRILRSTREELADKFGKITLNPVYGMER